MLCGTGKAYLTILVVCALIILGVAYLSPAAGRSGVSPHKLTILFTASDYGNVKPCG